jgi:hypothetical protein
LECLISFGLPAAQEAQSIVQSLNERVTWIGTGPGVERIQKGGDEWWRHCRQQGRAYKARRSRAWLGEMFDEEVFHIGRASWRIRIGILNWKLPVTYPLPSTGLRSIIFSGNCDGQAGKSIHSAWMLNCYYSFERHLFIKLMW